jgi:SAM-dependent methyltransferase
MSSAIKFKYLFQCLTRGKGKQVFINSLPKRSKVMDVGCGNNSALQAKKLRPDLIYIGLDIQDYQQSNKSKFLFDKYILTDVKNFHKEIIKYKSSNDAVISSHNLEHCNKRWAVLKSMCKSLKINGLLYLAFPSRNSLSYPSRTGTLNYYDDPTHLLEPPKLDKVISILEKNSMEILFLEQAYRPKILCFLGWISEPLSKILGRNLPLGITWAYWGFETVIWARRKT